MIDVVQKLYLVTHFYCDREGKKVYPVLSSTPPTEEEIVAACQIDYEPKQAEFIEIEEREPCDLDEFRMLVNG